MTLVFFPYITSLADKLCSQSFLKYVGVLEEIGPDRDRPEYPSPICNLTSETVLHISGSAPVSRHLHVPGAVRSADADMKPNTAHY